MSMNYIDLGAFLKELSSQVATDDLHGMNVAAGLELAKVIAQKQPTIDILRCRDCNFFFEAGALSASTHCSICGVCVSPDGYCDHGQVYNGESRDSYIRAYRDEVFRMNAVVQPYRFGTKLYKVTHPYRQEPKVTEFTVVNFRTAGKKHVLQVEVRVNGVQGTNWMPCSKFHKTREEAEAALRRKAE